jgi:hypothetical protein
MSDDLLYRVLFEVSDLSAKIDVELNKSKNKATEIGKNVGNSFASAFANATTAVLGTISLGKLGQKALDNVSQLQIAQSKYEVILGSAEKATTRLKELNKFAIESPFKLDEIVKADTILQNFGIRTEKSLKTIGNTSAITGSSMSDLALILGQLSQNKSRENLNQLFERGVIGMQDLTKAGITFAKDGSVVQSVDELYAKVQDIIAKKYEGGIDKLSKTLRGQLSTLSDNIDQTLGNILQNSGIYSFLVNSITKINEFVIAYPELTNAIAITVTSFVGLLTVFSGVNTAIGIFGPVISSLIGFFATTTTTVAGTTTAIGGFGTILAFVTGPIGITVVAIGAITGALIYLYNTNEIVKNGINFSINQMSSYFTYFKDHALEETGKIIGFFITLPIKLPLYVAEAINKITALISQVDWNNVWKGLENGAKSALNSIGNFFNSINWGDLLKKGGEGLRDFLKGLVKGIFAGVPGGDQAVKALGFANGGIVGFANGGQLINVNEGVGKMAGQELGIINANGTKELINSLVNQLNFRGRGDTNSTQNVSNTYNNGIYIDSGFVPGY